MAFLGLGGGGGIGWLYMKRVRGGVGVMDFRLDPGLRSGRIDLFEADS